MRKKVHYLRCRWAVTTEFDRFVDYEETAEIDEEYYQEELPYGKRVKRIEKIIEAKTWVDTKFCAIFAPKSFKFLEYVENISGADKVRLLEKVLPTGQLLIMRAKIPAQYLRLANASPQQQNNAEGSEGIFDETVAHSVQRRKETFTRDARRFERRWRKL